MEICNKIELRCLIFKEFYERGDMLALMQIQHVSQVCEQLQLNKQLRNTE